MQCCVAQVLRCGEGGRGGRKEDGEPDDIYRFGDAPP